MNTQSTIFALLLILIFTWRGHAIAKVYGVSYDPYGIRALFKNSSFKKKKMSENVSEDHKNTLPDNIEKTPDSSVQ